MKKFFKSMQLLALMLVAGGSFCLTSCSDDDDVNIPAEVTTATMFGSYEGKVTAFNIAPVDGEDNEDTTAPGADISAVVNNDTIKLVEFPVKDIVLAIVKDETLADKIMEEIGDVTYSIGYDPTLTADKDSIMVKLDPKPLKLTVNIPAAKDGEEAAATVVEVQVAAGENAGYAVADGNLKFHIAATKVMLGEGEQQQELPNFVPTTFHFDMHQNRISHLF